MPETINEGMGRCVFDGLARLRRMEEIQKEKYRLEAEYDQAELAWKVWKEGWHPKYRELQIEMERLRFKDNA